MKIQKRLNVILVILLVVLVSIISFGGIYYKNKNSMKNRVPDYILGADLTGYRRVVISPSEDKKDNETENETETNTSEDSESENTTDENVTEGESTNTSTNYKKTAEIIRKRLKTLDVENFTVSCNEDTGKIEIDLPEDDRTDMILSDITEVGKFEIKDADTNEILIDNSDIRNAKLTEQTSSSSVYEVLNINFTTKGTNKFKNITEKYQNTVSESNSSSDNETSSDENAESENTEETNNDSSESTSSHQVKISIDDSELLTTSFSEIVDNGQLSLTMGYKSSMTQDQIYGAQNICAIVGNDPLPIQYEVKENAYIAPETDESEMKGIIYIEIAIGLVLALYMIAKFRMQGIMQTIVNIGFMALLLIVIRLANVSISTSGIIACIVSYITSYIYGYILLKNLKENKDLNSKEINKLLKKVSRKYSLIIVPILIISIVSCLTKWVSLYSFGMIIFWGIIISFIYNILISKFLIKPSESKDK